MDGRLLLFPASLDLSLGWVAWSLGADLESVTASKIGRFRYLKSTTKILVGPKHIRVFQEKRVVVG